MLVLQLAFIYAPFMQVIFGSAPVTAGQLGLAVLVGASVIPVVALEKQIRARGSRRPTSIAR